MIRTLKQKYWADTYINHMKSNNGLIFGTIPGIPIIELGNIHLSLIEAGLIERMLPGGAKLTSYGWDFKDYLAQSRQFSDYPKLMFAYSKHMSQDYSNPDFEIIAKGED